MDKFNKQQVLQFMLSCEKLELTDNDIISVSEQSGGLVNYVFRIETKKGLFFLKQFLEELKADVFKNLEFGPKDRIRLSYDVGNKFEEILGENNHIVPHIYFYDEDKGYIILEGFTDVCPLVEKIKNGIFSQEVMLSLIRCIAQIHQVTFSENNLNYILYNDQWLDLKLKYQYYEMIKLLDKQNGKILKSFVDNYKYQRLSLVHGDLCSTNIFLKNNSNYNVHLIDFEDAHIGSPSFDIGYFLSEYFIAAQNFVEKKEYIYQSIKKTLDIYFEIFLKQNRTSVEIEITKHTASMMLYRTFGLSKDAFTKYLKNDKVRDDIKNLAIRMLNESDKLISDFC